MHKGLVGQFALQLSDPEMTILDLKRSVDRTISSARDVNHESGPDNGTLERAKGFEPSTPTLARSCSTPELRPLWRRMTGTTLCSPVG